MTNNQETIPLQRLNLSIAEACIFLGLSQAMVYRLCRDGKLNKIKQGGRSMITIKSLKHYASTSDE